MNIFKFALATIGFVFLAQPSGVQGFVPLSPKATRALEFSWSQSEKTQRSLDLQSERVDEWAINDSFAVKQGWGIEAKWQNYRTKGSSSFRIWGKESDWVVLTKKKQSDTTPPVVSGVTVAPNPFSPNRDRTQDTSNIEYSLSEKAQVTIKIMDSSNNLIRTLVNNKRRRMGFNQDKWNGKDDGKIVVPDGTYTYQIFVEDKAGNKATPFPIEETIIVDSPPDIAKVESSVFGDNDNSYSTNQFVRIEVTTNTTDLDTGTARITSASQGFDTGVLPILFSPFSKPFILWDTTGLNPSSDYKVEISLTDPGVTTATDDSLTINLEPNPPLFNTLVSDVDLQTPAVGIPVQVVRTYLLDSGFDGPMGFGWTNTYLMHVEDNSGSIRATLTNPVDGVVKVFNADGTGAFFTPTGGGSYQSPKGDFRTLTKNPDGTFLLREKFGTEFNFNQAGKLTSIVDRNGNIITLNYDSAGRLLNVLDASNQTTTFSYNSNDRISSVTDSGGRSVTYGYDGVGNLTSVTNFGGFQTTYAYDSKHNLKTITDPESRQTFFKANKDDRLHTFSHEKGNDSFKIKYFKPTPNQVTITDSLGQKILLRFDNNRSVTEINDPLNNTTLLSYDSDLNVTEVTNGNGNSTKFSYDSRGNVLTITDSLGNTSTRTYETVFNRPKSFIDAKGRTISLSYDSNGNLESMTYPDGSVERFAYDGLGNLSSRTDRMNQIINFISDIRGRLTKKSFPDGTSDTFTYDTMGNLLTATDEKGAINFQYDVFDRISQVKYPDGATVSYAYDSVGNRSQLIYPDGTTLDYVYDQANRLTLIKKSNEILAEYKYNKLSRPIRRELKNGTFTTYDYDKTNQLVQLINKKSPSQIISNFSYTYDGVGNRLTMATLAGTTHYAYDPLNQLVTILNPGGVATKFNFDSIGNRLSVEDNGSLINYVTNNLNQYSDVGGDKFTFDGNGNLKSKTTTQGTTVFSYDFENNLIGVQTPSENIEYVYDSLGRRISKVTGSNDTGFIYDGLDVIMEKDSAGAVQASYIYGLSLDEVLAMSRGGVDYFYSQDGLGSVTDLTDTSQNIVESYSYDSYGQPSSISTVGNPYLFTGREFDSETGLYYFRARYYDPRLGRFLSEDPIIIIDAAFNLYTYANNNPVNIIDPLGLHVSKGTGTAALEALACGLVSTSGGALIALGPAGWVAGIVGGIAIGVVCGVTFEIADNLSAGDPTFVQPPERGAWVRTLSPEDINMLGQQTNLLAEIVVPRQFSLVRGEVPIFGLAYGNDFKEYRVEIGEGSHPTKWFTMETSVFQQMRQITNVDLNDSAGITIHGNLATWDTGLRNYVYLPSHPKGHPIDLKGTYTIRLVVEGNDGNTVEDRVTVHVANVIPNAWGGEVTSPDGKIILFVPEQALMDSFRLILIQSAKNTSLIFSDERILVSSIYEVREPRERFTKDALLKMAYSRNELGDISPDQLGIYGYNLEKKEWEYLPSTRQNNADFVFTQVRQLHSYYALMASTLPGEGSRNKPLNMPGVEVHQVNFPTTTEHYLVTNTFEGDMGGWSNRDSEVGATVTLSNEATFDGTQALKITNTKFGGNFAVNVQTTSFDAQDYPMVQFDYRIPPDVKTNFQVKVAGRWYDIGFTDDPKDFRDKRVNIAPIGTIEDIVADDQWHTARFNLYDMLRTKTGHSLVEEMIMADWNVGGFMKLQFGHNREGATYFIDNFSISRETDMGLRVEQESLLVDDFNQRKSTNVFGKPTLLFVDSHGSHIEHVFQADQALGKGHSLALAYDVAGQGHYAGYATMFPNLDLRAYQGLSFFVKSLEPGREVFIGLRDQFGHEGKVGMSQYVSANESEDWQEVIIPLAVFSNSVDLGKVENLSFTFEGGSDSKGTLFVDSLEFRKSLSSFLVNDFNDLAEGNKLARSHRTFVSGAAAVNGMVTRDLGNGIFRLSYGGNIGEIHAYASDLFTYAGWTTELGGINCSDCQSLSFRIKGGEGGERPNIYLDDGNFRWSVDIAKYAPVTTDWQDVVIPLEDFAEYGVDLTHLAELQFAFEWEKMSGTIYIDDIKLGSAFVPKLSAQAAETGDTNSK